MKTLSQLHPGTVFYFNKCFYMVSFIDEMYHEEPGFIHVVNLRDLDTYLLPEGSDVRTLLPDVQRMLINCYYPEAVKKRTRNGYNGLYGYLTPKQIDKCLVNS